MAKTDLTAQRLRELLQYNQTSGNFWWRAGRRGAPKNRPAGAKNGLGYIVLTVDGRLYLAHRLAWLFMTGQWPDGVIDHLNGVAADNSFENLRDVTQSVNRQNLRRACVNGESGFLGVTRDRIRNKWLAIIYVNKKRIFLGRFDAPADAYTAYLDGKRRLHQGCTI